MSNFAPTKQGKVGIRRVGMEAGGRGRRVWIIMMMRMGGMDKNHVMYGFDDDLSVSFWWV